MTPSRARRASLGAQLQVERAFAALERFLHIEAASGIVLVLAAVVALVWANSPAADSYHHLWHTEVTLGFGALSVSRSLHFLINDALMTVFFLVVGMEIRREIHQGALASLRQAALPLGAALGGVVVPALVFVALNAEPAQRQGWAVPTATDIAFAVGVLALLGRSIPGNVRILLLAIAIIDDIVAVLVIALFYSGGLEYAGLAVAALGLGMVVLLQWLGIASPYAYVAPGAVVWLGLLQTGAHPTLAGVALGLMTPVLARRGGEPLDQATAALAEICDAARDPARGADHIAGPLRRLRVAQRDLMPPVTRVQMALHPWVAYGVMPLFALANAGVTVSGFDAQAAGSAPVMLGVGVALALGKPVGIVGIAWLMVRLRWCSLPPGVTWGGVALVGLLAGIGFTMSIFIATLGYADPNLLAAAKLGVLGGSAAAAVAGLGWGVWLIRGRPRQIPG